MMALTSQHIHSKDLMKRIFFFAFTILACTISLPAQTFTEHLESKVVGQGTVTIHQDPALEDMVNGKKQVSTEKKEEKKEDSPILSGKKIKARGYRIQVYWGGSTRNDKTQAQHAGARISNRFPELQTYTNFESPNWRCRVGDFVTYQEATDYLQKLKDAKLSQGAIIVKSEVFIYQ